jgi:ribulose-phosphate 3-epimerase
MVELVPTILTSNFSEYLSKLQRLEGVCPRVQIDLIDGKFAPKETVSIESLKDQESSLITDLHLMVKEPEDWVHRALELLPDRLIGQVEMMYDIPRFISETIEGGMRVGLALDLETPIEAIAEEVYHQTDLILLLSVKAGEGGQEFKPKVLEKIKKVKAIVGDLVPVGVDGGLNEKNIVLCKEAGAEIFCIGTNFWQAEDLQGKYQELTNLVA